MRTKIFFLFAMLASIVASAQVTHVEPVGANYANKTVSFRVWWNAGSRDVTHLSKVWVWVDYLTVNSNNTTSGNTWARATVGTISPATGISYDGTNRNGFWLEGNASANYSATLTVQLTNVPTKFNWCAYVSDYPPNVTANNGTYTFKGTPPFTLIASNGATKTVPGKTLAVSALTITPTTIRDKTECPGVFCIYSGSDLYIDATHLCQQRTSGAQNWEAWIKDARDDELYRIVYMPDNKWWLAQNVKLASYLGTSVGVAFSQGNKDESGLGYTIAETIGAWGGTNGQGANIQGICPSGWVLPMNSDWVAFLTAVEPTVSLTAYAVGGVIGVSAVNTSAVKKLTTKDTYCYQGEDIYGWAQLKDNRNSVWRAGTQAWWGGSENSRYHYHFVNHRPGYGNDCGWVSASTTAQDFIICAVRCFRQL
ncbi:MAG: hypothetical protein LBF81_02185 [Prevotellaceae bacterium]|nr:hypothetical protein [Prevotellaceae bacterium]